MPYTICNNGGTACGTKPYDPKWDCCVPCEPCKKTCEPCTTKKAKCDPCTKSCDPCFRPYTVTCVDCDGCETVDLCVCPDECLMADDTYKNLYCELKKAIIFYRLDLLLRNLDSSNYDDFAAIGDLIAGRVTDGRLVVTIPDGTVVYETGQTNSWANYQAKDINENHNTRVAVHDAQGTVCGVGYEKKLSSTTNQVEQYVAIRLGEYLCSEGTARLSVPFAQP